ncbi:hypothetical protein PLICRDRAFT_113984 [Plicaturopsis crispa FD-325 SS-3]|nr:hypothetical protein PLICRDRAFT_113984 [Plicaturopsis crispa FD-325 SS-3]
MAASTRKLDVAQTSFVVPELTIKQLLDSIPAHCFKRSALRSSVYIVWDLFIIGCFYKATTFGETFLTPDYIPNDYARSAAWVSLWALYGFWAGLFGTGLWVIAHECGHQAFSESKTINNTVGWVLHSALGVPYQAWRITHAKHHASTGHMTQDQVHVPKTRSQRGLPPLDLSKEDVWGSSVADEVKKELYEALGDSPIGACWHLFTYFSVGWIAYLLRNASGQRRYPKGTNHFNPNAVMFAPHQATQIMISNLGIAIWLTALITSIYTYGFAQVFRVYLVPYLWVNHWLVLITLLQHTDPLLPHYRAPEFTFPRGALCTMDRNLLGDLGSVAGWIGAHATHGISETHVAHHVSSKIPHYNAWEATDALRKTLEGSGMKLQGGAVGWAEAYRIWKECKFVEDEGNVVFFKNAYGLAHSRPIFAGDVDSGIEVDK